jgi:hypothetical protein
MSKGIYGVIMNEFHTKNYPSRRILRKSPFTQFFWIRGFHGNFQNIFCSVMQKHVEIIRKSWRPPKGFDWISLQIMVWWLWKLGFRVFWWCFTFLDYKNWVLPLKFFKLVLVLIWRRPIMQILFQPFNSKCNSSTEYQKLGI